MATLTEEKPMVSPKHPTLTLYIPLTRRKQIHRLTPVIDDAEPRYFWSVSDALDGLAAMGGGPFIVETGETRYFMELIKKEPMT